MNNKCFICDKEIENKSIKFYCLKSHVECFKSFKKWKQKYIIYLDTKINKD